LAVRPAQAAGESEPGPISTADALNDEGTELYRARDYRRAVEKFLEAYALDGDPNLLFNVARCYDALGNVDAAIEKYEAFTRSPEVDREGRARAQVAIRRLQRPPVAAPIVPTVGRGATEVAQVRATDQPLPRSDWTRLSRWVALGAGVAATATGTVLLVSGAHDHQQVTSAPGFGDPLAVDPMKQREAQDLVDAGHTKKVAGGILLGVGAAALVTSATLFVLDDLAGAGRETSREHLSLQCAPELAGGATLSLRGRF